MDSEIPDIFKTKPGVPFNGMSWAAGRRWQERNRGKTYTGAPDGSFRRNY